MRLSRIAAVAVVVVMASVGSTLGAAAAEQPNAADVGITDSEIRVAVIADVDNPAAPGLFQASVDTMRAWAKIVNKSGGLAGRKVVIDFIDSKLNPNEARAAVIKACAEDFAMVGTESLFLNNVDDLVGCKDAQGNAIGIPDIPGIALDAAEKCSPVTYMVNGDASFCATLDENPQTYTAQQGDALYYVKKNTDLHGVWIGPNDLQAAKNALIPIFQAGADLGIEKDGDGFYYLSQTAPQSAYTPVVQVLKNDRSSFAYVGGSFETMLLLRREAKIQSATSVKVWGCNQGCYDLDLIEQGGSDVEGTYSVLTTLPFYSEYKSNPALKALVKQLGGPAKLNGNGASAYTAALLFQDAVEQAVADGGTLTRQSLFDALDAEHAFDAQGIMGPTDIGNHEQPGCIVLNQVKNGKFVRVYPKKVGTFDCKKKNLVEMQLDLN